MSDLIVVKDLLKAVPGQNPCGEDIGRTKPPEFLQLRVDAQRKPARTVSVTGPDGKVLEKVVTPAHEPDWGKILNQSKQLFIEKSKHLELAFYICQGSWAIGKWAAIPNALQLVQELLENHWMDLYPKLDGPKNDPSERLAWLSKLSPARDAEEENTILLDGMRAEALCQIPASVTSITANEIARYKAGSSKTTESQMQQALEGFIAEKREAIKAAVFKSLAHIKAIEAFLQVTVGSLAPKWETLYQTLTDVHEFLSGTVRRGLGKGEVTSSGGGVKVEVERGGESAGGSPPTGEVKSRPDVKNQLKLIWEYYDRQEPSSPIRLILRRAASLVEADFCTLLDAIPNDERERLKEFAKHAAETAETPGHGSR